MKDINITISEKPSGIITIRTKNRVSKYPMKSMTQNYWRILSDSMRGNTENVIVRSDGSLESISSSLDSGNRFQLDAGNSNTWGIRVGTGLSNVSLEDISLDTAINHGSLNGQLNYLDCLVKSEDQSVSLVRVFENLSGSPILISEAGIFARREVDSLSNNNPYMFARDLLPEAEEIQDSELCTISAGMSVANGTRNACLLFKNFDSNSATETFYHSDGTTSQRLPTDINCYDIQGSDEGGILAGMGDRENDFNDIDLEERISNGAGYNNLIYGEMEISPYSIIENTISWRMSRTILNISGESIVIKEIGVFAFQQGKRTLLYRVPLPNEVSIGDQVERTININFRYFII